MCLAVPLKLLEISPDRSEGRVDMAGALMTVNLSLVPEAKQGDYVLIHAGMAIEIMREDEAQVTLDAYREYAHIPGMLSPGAEPADD